MRNRYLSTVLVCSFLIFFQARSRAEAGDFVFGNGFESGTTCAWSTPGCSADFVLGHLENATTASENEAAFLLALETTIGSVPPEVRDSLSLMAEVVIDYPQTRGAFLNLAQAHELATLSLDSPPTLQAALAILATDVAQAYANPTSAESTDIILMFSSTSDMTSPLPLTTNTSLTLTGSIYYGAWLAEAFPQSFGRSTKISSAACTTLVAINQAAAVQQVLVRNMAGLVARIFLAVSNALEAAISCPTLGLSEALGIFLDLAKDCAISEFVSWIEVEADADCIADAVGPSNLAGCVASSVPCIGDINSAIVNGAGVAGVIENTVNGICTVINSRNGLFDACNEGCEVCSELEVETRCGFGNILACFDPINNLPTVSCVLSDDPACDDFGVPVITRVDGSTIVTGGGSTPNRVYFTDEDAGINWFSTTPVSDTCGGCASFGSWDPGVSQETSGSFQLVWSCTCGSSGADFQATYQHRLFDSQGNVSPVFTQQVGCTCVSSNRSESSTSEEQSIRLIRVETPEE